MRYSVVSCSPFLEVLLQFFGTYPRRHKQKEGDCTSLHIFKTLSATEHIFKLIMDCPSPRTQSTRNWPNLQCTKLLGRLQKKKPNYGHPMNPEWVILTVVVQKTLTSTSNRAGITRSRSALVITEVYTSICTGVLRYKSQHLLRLNSGSLETEVYPSTECPQRKQQSVDKNDQQEGHQGFVRTTKLSLGGCSWVACVEIDGTVQWGTKRANPVLFWSK